MIERSFVTDAHLNPYSVTLTYLVTLVITLFSHARHHPIQVTLVRYLYHPIQSRSSSTRACTAPPRPTPSRVPATSRLRVYRSPPQLSAVAAREPDAIRRRPLQKVDVDGVLVHHLILGRRGSSLLLIHCSTAATRRVADACLRDAAQHGGQDAAMEP